MEIKNIKDLQEALDAIGGASNLQATYENGSLIVTDNTNGALKLQVGSGSDTDPLIQGFNTAGVLVFEIYGNGNINTSGLFNSRDIGNDGLKLDTIESGATNDQTPIEIKTAYEANSNTNEFSDSEKSKLASLEGSKFLGQYVSLNALQTAHPSPAVGSYANVDAGVGTDVKRYIWDSDDSSYVEQGAVNNALTDAEIKTQYENNANTNAFTDTEKTKLSGIETNATTDQTDNEIKTAYENNANTNAFTDVQKTKLTGIEDSATIDQTDQEIETAYNNQVSVVSQANAEAGTGTSALRWTPERVKQAIDALSPTSSTDVNAVHKNQPNEITPITSKIVPSVNDVILMEDSQDNASKKSLLLYNLIRFARIPRVFTTTGSSLVPQLDSQDHISLTANGNFQFGNPVGTRIKDMRFTVRIVDNGTPRAITYHSSYIAIGVVLPTTTVANKIMHFGFKYDEPSNKFEIIAFQQQL